MKILVRIVLFIICVSFTSCLSDANHKAKTVPETPVKKNEVNEDLGITIGYTGYFHDTCADEYYYSYCYGCDKGLLTSIRYSVSLELEKKGVEIANFNLCKQERTNW